MILPDPIILSQERVDAFLAELTALTCKHGIAIEGSLDDELNLYDLDDPQMVMWHKQNHPNAAPKDYAYRITQTTAPLYTVASWLPSS